MICVPGRPKPSRQHCYRKDVPTKSSQHEFVEWDVAVTTQYIRLMMTSLHSSTTTHQDDSELCAGVAGAVETVAVGCRTIFVCHLADCPTILLSYSDALHHCRFHHQSLIGWLRSAKMRSPAAPAILLLC